MIFYCFDGNTQLVGNFLLLQLLKTTQAKHPPALVR